MKKLLVLCAITLLAAASPAPAGAGEPDRRSAGKNSPGKAAGTKAPESGAGEKAPDSLEHVRSFMHAFNLHDPEAMMEHLTPGVQWLNIEGTEISVEATGVEEVRKAMEAYFQAVPAARAVMEDPMVSGRYVIFRERAYWEPSGQRTQSSLAVYEMKGGLIHRVWYFPSEE